MKPRRLLLAAAAASLLCLAACSKPDNGRTQVDNAKAAAADTIARARDAISNTWISIKDFTYEKRADFTAGVERMSKELDEQAAALKAKAAETPQAASGATDSAKREFDAARANLKESLDQLNHATAENWADAKAKVVDAWRRLQAAWDRQVQANRGS